MPCCGREMGVAGAAEADFVVALDGPASRAYSSPPRITWRSKSLAPRLASLPPESENSGCATPLWALGKGVFQSLEESRTSTSFLRRMHAARLRKCVLGHGNSRKSRLGTLPASVGVSRAEFGERQPHPTKRVRRRGNIAHPKDKVASGYRRRLRLPVLLSL